MRDKAFPRTCSVILCVQKRANLNAVFTIAPKRVSKVPVAVPSLNACEAPSEKAVSRQDRPTFWKAKVAFFIVFRHNSPETSFEGSCCRALAECL